MQNSAQRDGLLLISRILLSSLFLIMGWIKLTGFDVTVGYMHSLHTPLPTLAAIIAIIVELGGGLAILLGIFVTPIALLLAVYTIITALIGHQFWIMSGMMRYDMLIHFYKNFSLAGGLIALSLAGSGRYALLKKKAS